MNDDTPITQKQWREHQQEDRKHFEERPTKDEMKQIVHDALIEFFSAKGLLGKNILVTTATIIGSLVVIGGGIKWILGIMGISIMSK